MPSTVSAGASRSCGRSGFEHLRYKALQHFPQGRASVEGIQAILLRREDDAPIEQLDEYLSSDRRVPAEEPAPVGQPRAQLALDVPHVEGAGLAQTVQRLHALTECGALLLPLPNRLEERHEVAAGRH